MPGSLVAPIIPSASASGTYQTVVGINDDGEIATLKVSGAFFSASGDVTYDLTFDGMVTRQGPNYREMIAKFTVKDDGKVIGVMEPSKRNFPSRQSSTT